MNVKHVNNNLYVYKKLLHRRASLWTTTKKTSLANYKLPPHGITVKIKIGIRLFIVEKDKGTALVGRTRIALFTSG